MIEMNKETLELLLKQNLSTVKEFVSLLFGSLKDEINMLKSENDELKKRLLFTQSELDQFRKSSAEHTGQLRRVAEDNEVISDITERLGNLEDYSRKKNVIVEGLPEPNGESKEMLEYTVKKLMKEKLDVEADIEVTHRLGKPSDNKPRSVIVKLKNFRDRQNCLRATPRLKGTNV